MSDPAINALFSVSDLPKLIFSWLDLSSLALAAWVCTKWRDTARDVRGGGKMFQLVLADLVPRTALLTWANKNIIELPPKLRRELCARAAGKGALATLQWARENNCLWDEYTCAFAAEGGHLAVLQWARKNGCDWTKLTCSFAAEYGHLAVLQWARENGCEWDRYICSHAAEGGHLAMLQWARKNGCDWYKLDCLRRAKEYKHAAVEAWIAAQPE